MGVKMGCARFKHFRGRVRAKLYLGRRRAEIGVGTEPRGEVEKHNGRAANAVSGWGKVR